MPVRVGLDATLNDLALVNGWLTDAQALRLWSRAAALSPPATIVEIGSFQGRSTIVLARAAARGVAIVAIDPHAGNDRGPQELEGFEAEAANDNVVFNENLTAAGVRDRVTHVRKFSSDAHDDVDGDVELLYIDGAHRYRPALDDIQRWGRRVAPGGTLLIHDSFSSIGVTLAIMRELFASTAFRYIGRSGSLTEYRREHAAATANARAQATALPWFAKNVILKALIAARIVKRPWPY